MKMLNLLPGGTLLPSLSGALLALFAACAWPAVAQEPSVKLRQQEALPQGTRLVLAIAPPTVTTAIAPNGKTYTRLELKGSGVENQYGWPALPFVRQVVEVPAGLRVSVRVEERELQELKVTEPIWPFQKPVPKLPGAKEASEFLVEAAAYADATPQKAWNGDVEVTPYRKRGQDFVEILARPFAYDAVRGVVRYPTELVLELTYSAPDLPKAAGPRTGKIVVLDVGLRGKADVEWLQQEGFNFELRGTKRAEVFATEAEAQRLKAAGFEYREVAPLAPPGPTPKDGKDLGVYHDYPALTTLLQQYTNDHPSVCRLISIGRSVQNRELWAMKLTDQPGVASGKPRVRLAGTMHGDEPLGAEMCLYLIDLLANGSPTNARVANLLASTEVWVLPLLNPDGRMAGTRFNAAGYDLNRSFPDGGGSGLGNALFGPALTVAGRPPEVASVMQFGTNHSFSLAANFHGGALVVNYPYDDDELGAVDSPSPDDALFEFISLAYSVHNPPMYGSSTFAQGIVNGADWYVAEGSLQDWSYRYVGCNEVTIEISEIKQPPASQLGQFWNENRESMLSYLETVHTGVQGLITDAVSGQPVYAAVKAMGVQHGVFSDPQVGDYHRMLRPGTYHLVFTAPEHATLIVSNIVVHAGVTTRSDVTLQRVTHQPERVLLVTCDSLSASLPGLKARKEADGFEVQELVVANGSATNRIRSLIRDAFAIFPADYILIVGDTPQIPAFLDTHPTDLPYALMDTGETAANYLGKDAVLGRISLTTPAAIGQFVQKVAAFANTRTNRVGDVTWVSNGNTSSEYDQAERCHDYCINNCIPPAYNNTLFYENIGSAAALTAHINEGTDGVIYSGHGGEFTWVRYDYDVATLAGLNNVLHVPVVIGHCCVAGSFDEPVCFAEAWLQTTARGVTYVGATDNTYWDEDEWMQMAEFDAMAATAGLSVGKAIDEGLYRVQELAPSNARYYYTAYHVLGDPTTVMYDAVPLPLTIRSVPELPTANRGLPYSATLRALGGAQPYTWTVTGGELPGGLNFSGAGVLAGVATNTGTYEFTVQVVDSSPTQQLATATFTLAVQDMSASFNQALDTTNWPWAPGGDAYWLLQSVTTQDGMDAVESGFIGSSQQTWIETVATGPGTLSFWWKVSSESGYDFLEFYVNGALQTGRISGDVNWQNKVYALNDGPQTLRWRYTKDSSENGLQDRGWVDQVRFITSLAPTIAGEPQSVTATTGETTGFTVSVVGAAPLSYQWFFIGSPMAGATASACVLANVQTNQGGSYWVVVTNSHGAVTSQVVQLTVVSGISLAEAIDQSDWPISTGGTAPWRGQYTNTHDSVDAAQCGDISHSQETWLQTSVVGPGQLSFWWKVSSELGYDYLDCYTNAVSIGTRISGNVDWQLKTLRLADGLQTLRWRYSKDASADSYLDSAWVDGVTWIPDSPVPTISQSPRSAAVLAGEPVTFSVLASGEKPLSYQWYKGGSLLPRETAASYSLAAAHNSDAGTYTVSVTNAYGAATSAPAQLIVLAPGSIRTNSYSVGTPIAIPAVGPATPYPATITVTNLPGVVRQVTATLVRLTHTYPSDLNVLLVGPTGLPVMLMGSVGGGTDATNVSLTFDAQALASLTGSALVSGTFRPTDLSDGATLPTPAPGRPYASGLSTYAGSDPNGQWRLYVADSATGDSGNVAGGWNLRIVTLQTEAPLVLIDVGYADAAIRFGFMTVVGRTYQVEYREVFDDGDWKILESHSGDGGLHTCTDPAGAATQRFYRLRVE